MAARLGRYIVAADNISADYKTRKLDAHSLCRGAALREQRLLRARRFLRGIKVRPRRFLRNPATWPIRNREGSEHLRHHIVLPRHAVSLLPRRHQRPPQRRAGPRQRMATLRR
jgi:hypothetical protein